MSSEVGRTPSVSTVDRMVHAVVKELHNCRVISVDVAEAARLADVDPDTARHLFPDNDALEEAVASFGIMKLSDAMNRALLAVPADDSHAVLGAMARAYVRFALDNRELAHVLTQRLMQTDRTNSIVWRYDRGFVPLVRRFLGEPDENPSRRATMARAFLFGLTDLAVHGHFELWKTEGADYMADIDATIDDFSTLILGGK